MKESTREPIDSADVGLALQEEANFYFALGSVAGAIAQPGMRKHMVAALASRRLNPGYVSYLRNELTKVLQESGHE